MSRLLKSMPQGIAPEVIDSALAYAERGAAGLDPTNEEISTRRSLLFCRVDITATTQFRFFDTISQSRFITNLDKGRLSQGRVAVLNGFCFDIGIGRDVAGTAGPFEVLGAHEAGAADATDATEIASAYGAMAAKVDILRHGSIDVKIGTKTIFNEEFGLTRFPWPGGLDISGPGFDLLGAYPATNNTKRGSAVVNNGLPANTNLFPLCPNPILMENLQAYGLLTLPLAPTLPAGYKLTAIMAFDAQIFGPSNNT